MVIVPQASVPQPVVVPEVLSAEPPPVLSAEPPVRAQPPVAPRPAQRAPVRLPVALPAAGEALPSPVVPAVLAVVGSVMTAAGIYVRRLGRRRRS